MNEPTSRESESRGSDPSARHLAASTIVKELPATLRPFDALCKLAHLPFPALLDSALPHPRLGSQSFVAADPFDFLLSKTASGRDVQQIDRWHDRFSIESIPSLPDFQGGVITLCGFDVKHCFESLPQTIDEFQYPALFAGCYDTVIAFDHIADRTYLISTGFPETEEAQRRLRAEQRLRQFESLLLKGSDVHRGTAAGSGQKQRVTSELLRPQFDTGLECGVTSNFSRSDFVAAVQQAIDYIHAGDIFQVNLAQRLLAPQESDPLELYSRLRDCNPATFGGYLDLGDFQILSSSPERLIQIDSAGKVETRPIKGTRERSRYPEANLFLAEGLITSEKDRSENVMIVDLLRNDLSRFCEPDSLHVSKLCGLEQYEYVQHLVSVIEGQVTPDVLPSIKRNESRLFWELLKSIFPGGSITGAPKVRAMEIIHELEQTARGAYCGSLGYYGFNGTIDQNILIRTMTVGRGWVQIPVGGGIVAQSDPVSEYEETLHKARGMLRSLRPRQVSPSA